MKRSRPIIEIDEEKCTGCGACILSCAEGALQLVDGKARLVGEIFCDGLGACLGECPEGALRVIDREADEFDESAVEERLKELAKADVEKPAPPEPAHACPGAAHFDLRAKACECVESTESMNSTLGHWPVKLQLLGPQAPFLKGADLLLLADCVGIAYPDIHRKLIPGKVVAMGCPKLDDLQAHIERLTEIIRNAGLRSLTVVHMEVPCCSGFVSAAQEAVRCAGVELPVRRIMVARGGEILEEEPVAVPQGA